MANLASIHPKTASTSKPTWADFAITIALLVLCWVRLAHHEVWRDEANVWGIAAASPKLTDLFAKLHYEGHPPLWYLLIWLATRVFPSFSTLKIVQALVVACIYLILGLWSPFSKVERVLLLCSYYVFFEYTVLSRTYGLCFLVLLIYLLLRFRRPQRILVNVICLGVLANCETLGLMLAASVFLEYAWSLRITGASISKLARAALLLGCMAAFSCWSAFPAPDVSIRTTGRVFEWAHEPRVLFAALVANTSIPWCALRFTYPRPFWNPGPGDPLLNIFLAFPILHIYWLTVRKRTQLLFVLGSTLALAIAFSFLIYFGSTRNFGVVFMAFLFCIWAIRFGGERLPRAAIALLAVSALQGLLAGAADFEHPFSNARAAARWLEAHQLRDANLIGTPDTSVAGIAEQLARPIYFLDCNCSDTYLSFHSRRDAFTSSEVPARLEQALRKLGSSNSILLLVDPVTAALEQALHSHSIDVVELARLTGAEAAGEDFYIYKVLQHNALPVHASQQELGTNRRAHGQPRNLRLDQQKRI